MESQQAVLLTLASDFNRYLTFKPEAHIVLEGHADRRGSMQQNKDLTERRVQTTKDFLVQHGVPAANIETQSFGKQENLNAGQVKQLIEQNPDLNNEERQRIEASSFRMRSAFRELAGHCVPARGHRDARPR